MLWDMGTTIGRPKRKADIALPPTPNLIPTEENKSPSLEEPSGVVIQESCAIRSFVGIKTYG